MAEIRRGSAAEGAGRPGPATGERLPWLDPVDEVEEGGEGPAGSFRGALLAAVAVLVLIALATAAMLAARHRAARTAAGQIIRPEPGPYKVRPADPGGMKPDMSEQVAARTGAGQDIDAPLDAAAMPETAMVTTRAAPPAAPPAAGKASPAATASATAAAPQRAPAPTPTRAETRPAELAPARVAARPEPPAPPGGAIQLGAFSSEAKAKAAWKALSGRFDFLADMTPSFAAATVGQATLYRLRATGGTAGSPQAVCARLKLAGETCAVIGG